MVLLRLLFKYGIFAAEMSRGAFPLSFSMKFCESNPLLTFLPLAYEFGSPEVVFFAGAKSLEARVSTVPCLLAELGLGVSTPGGRAFQAIP